MKARLLSVPLAMLLTGCYTSDPLTNDPSNFDFFSSIPLIPQESTTATPDIPMEPLPIVTYKGRLFFNDKQVTGAIDCEGMALDDHGQFSFTAINGHATVRCSFGVISDLVTFKYQTGTNDDWEQANNTVKTFNFDSGSNLGKHAKDAYTLLDTINSCAAEENKLCLKLWDSYDIEPLYRSGDRRAISSFVESVAMKKEEKRLAEEATMTTVETEGESAAETEV